MPKCTHKCHTMDLNKLSLLRNLYGEVHNLPPLDISKLKVISCNTDTKTKTCWGNHSHSETWDASLKPGYTLVREDSVEIQLGPK